MSGDEKKGADDAELETWRGEWQRLGGRDDFAAELVTRAARDASRMRRAAILEVASALLATGFLAIMTVRAHGSAELMTITVLVVLYCGWSLGTHFGVRATLFRQSGESLDDFIALTRRRLDAESRSVRYSRYGLIAFWVVLTPWLVWMFLAHREAYLAHPASMVVGFGGAPAITAGVFWRMRRKARSLDAERDRFERHASDAQVA